MSEYRVRSIAPPKESFASFSKFLQVDDDNETRALLEHDLRIAHSAKQRGDDEAYSDGNTFFVKSDASPRCFLEALALQIFHLHVEESQKLEKTDEGYEEEEEENVSGVEWWTLVLDDNEDDDDNEENGEDESCCEVGLHYDADYGLEAESNGEIVLHPLVATVTYLSNYGSPTCIFDVHGAQDICTSDPEHGSLLDIKSLYCSAPLLGKHIAFDGSLIHGAPSSIFASPLEHEEDNHAKSSYEKFESDTKKPRIEIKTHRKIEENVLKSKRKVRLTFLANIWLGHCPIDAEKLSEDLLSQMKMKASALIQTGTEPKSEDTRYNESKESSNSTSLQIKVIDDLRAWKDTLPITEIDGNTNCDEVIEAEIANRACKIGFQSFPPISYVRHGSSLIFKWKNAGSCTMTIGNLDDDGESSENE